MRGETDHAGLRRNKKNLHSDQFIVPGAHDYNRVLGALNIVIVLNALDFFYSAWGTFVSKCHRLR